MPQRGWRAIARLVFSDYEAAYSYKPETPGRRRLLLVPRLLTNTSLHANVLIRLMVGAPGWSAYLWRRLMVSSHSMDVSRHITVGPALELPHPFGLVIGTQTDIGAGVVLHHGVSMGPSGGREHGRVWAGVPDQNLVIGDGAVLYPYCHVQADVGEGAQVVNHSVVFRPVPEHCVVAGSPARVIRDLRTDPLQAGPAGTAAPQR